MEGLTVTQDALAVEAIGALADRIRALTLEVTLAAGGGYVSQACSAAEILAALYGGVLRLGPLAGPREPDVFRAVPGRPGANPTGRRHHGEPGPDLDRFIVSPSHYALAVYSALAAVDRLDPTSLLDFNQDGTTLEMIGAEHSPGFELTTGSMGQALSQAIGIALARRLRGEAGHVWVFMGDGELQEGQVWEAVQFAGVARLGTVRVVVDVNGQQVDGAVSDVLDNGPLATKFTGFGAEVVEVDGHDVEQLLDAMLRPVGAAPLVVLARTDPARGMPALRARMPRTHYVRVHDDAERAALTQDLEALRAPSEAS
jgi:transketolase